MTETQKKSNIIVTGCAGFIGFHLTKRLLELGYHVHGFDNINDYYKVSLKKDRLQLLKHTNFHFHEADLAAHEFQKTWEQISPQTVYHLAAQAGVRASLTHPEKYIQSNIQAFFHVLEACRKQAPEHFIYASSSSVYGNLNRAPFNESEPCNNPVSLYAATKKSNEMMAYTYSHLFHIRATGLRFFTVYGSWGRPDMAYYTFTKNLFDNKEIQLFEAKKQKRDFTHISDVVESLVRLKDKRPTLDSENQSYHRVLNIGAQNPITLLDMVKTIEDVTGREFLVQNLPAQKGEVLLTYANSQSLHDLIDYTPCVGFKEGYIEFFKWFKEYELSSLKN